MGIRTVIVIVFGLAVASAQAGTNSWTYTGANVNNYHWDVNNSWSLGAAPSISDYADYITNAVTKTVVINANDTSFAASTLTISNLTVAGVASTTNTLALTNMNAGALIPLKILNGLTIGDGGQLHIIYSMLQASNAVISGNAVLKFALGTNSSSVVVSNNLTLGGTLNVADGGGFFTKTNYTLFTYGGVLTYNGLTIGTTPSNVTCSIDTSVTGQVNLVASQLPPPPSGSFQIISIVQNADDISITWTASSAGTNYVQATAGDVNGGYSTNNFQDISDPIVVGAGSTNTYPDFGGATNAPSRFYRIRFPQ